MVRMCVLAVFAFSLICLPGLAGTAAAKVILDRADPVGDDLGDGDYVYPTDPSFGDLGEADLTHVKIEEDGEILRFTLTFRNLVDPWKVGNRLTFAAVAIDSKKGGIDELGHAAFARLEAPAEFVIYYGGDTVELTDAEGAVADPGVRSRVDMDANTVVIEVPVAVIGKPGKKWKYTVAAGLQDDYGGGGIGDFRLVNAQAAQWRGGGGDDLAINPNVYDILMPAKAKDLERIGKDLKTQADVLGNYSLKENRLAILPYVRP